MVNTSARDNQRFKRFLFAFATTLVHEAGPHVLITFLANGRVNTPKSIGVQGYNPRDEGESGRWFELSVFGGTIEYYRNLDEDYEQVGLPYQIDSDGNAWSIPDSFINLICDLHISFPFPRGNWTDRRLLERMGKYFQGPVPDGRRFMATQLDLSHLKTFTVSKASVGQVPENPRIRLQAIA